GQGARQRHRHLRRPAAGQVRRQVGRLHAHDPGMISFDDAFARLIADLEPTEPETVSLAAAAGRVLAAPLMARRTQPPVPTSAMDVFAVRAASLAEPGSRLRL